MTRRNRKRISLNHFSLFPSHRREEGQTKHCEGFPANSLSGIRTLSSAFLPVSGCLGSSCFRWITERVSMDAPWALASPSMTWRGRKSTRPQNQTNEVQILAFPHISSMTSSPGSCLSLSFLVIKWKGCRECEWWLVEVYGPEENGTQPIIFETL